MRCIKECDFEISMLSLCSPSQISPIFTNFHETYNYAIVDHLSVIQGVTGETDQTSGGCSLC